MALSAIYLENKNKINNFMKNILYLYKKDSITLLIIILINYIFIILYINLLLLLIMEIKNTYLFYLIPIIQINIFNELLPYKLLINDLNIGNNNNLNNSNILSNEINNPNNGRGGEPSSELSISEAASDSMKSIIKRKLEFQVEESVKDSRGAKKLKPIFSNDYSDKARFNTEEKDFMKDYISARPESGYSVRTM
jgi:hypothetical protein